MAQDGKEVEMRKQNTISAYDQIAPEFSQRNFEPFWISEFAQYQKLLPSGSIIDIGCGAGRDSAVFTASGFDYTGIDASQGMLTIAKSRAPRGRFLKMDFYNLEFPDNTFDGFWAAAAFLHVPKSDVSKLITEAKRVIRRGGIGFVSLKERNGMSEGVIQEDKGRYGGISRYFAFYEEAEFKKYLIDAGLEVVGSTKYREDDARHTVWLGFFIRKP